MPRKLRFNIPPKTEEDLKNYHRGSALLGSELRVRDIPIGHIFRFAEGPLALRTDPGAVLLTHSVGRLWCRVASGYLSCPVSEDFGPLRAVIAGGE